MRNNCANRAEVEAANGWAAAAQAHKVRGGLSGVPAQRPLHLVTKRRIKLNLQLQLRQRFEILW
jgi:hypothetical protein